MREGLTEPELAVYDLMIQDVALTEKERNLVKEIAKELTEKMEAILVILLIGVRSSALKPEFKI